MKKKFIMEKKFPNFSIYIKKILTQVHPDLKLSKEVKIFMNDLLATFLNQFIHDTVILMDHNRSKTLSSRDVQSTVRLFFVGTIAKHAVSEGTKVVTKFVSFVKKQKQKKRISNAKKCHLIIPPSRIRTVFEIILPEYTHNTRISFTAPVYLAAVTQYFIAELMELSGNVANKNQKSIIHIDCLKHVIQNDDELKRTLCKLPLRGETPSKPPL